MSNKTCGDCRHFDGRYNLCAVTSDFCTVEPDYSACDDFEQKPKPTNGDRVRKMSNRELAELLDEVNCFYCPYENKKNGMCNRPEGKTCIDGIEEWLNAPAKAESEVDND